jgi:hypothetical protein
MARFVLEDVDWDQTGGGVGSAIPELQRQLPIAAKPVRWIPGPDRPDYLLATLERPIRYHPDDQFDWGRTQAEFVGTDDDGRFVWIYAVIVGSLFAGTQMHAGMRNHAVRVAYVIDNTLGRDRELDFAKCDYIGQGSISDPPDGQTSAG